MLACYERARRSEHRCPCCNLRRTRIIAIKRELDLNYFQAALLKLTSNSEGTGGEGPIYCHFQSSRNGLLNYGPPKSPRSFKIRAESNTYINAASLHFMNIDNGGSAGEVMNDIQIRMVWIPIRITLQALCSADCRTIRI